MSTPRGDKEKLYQTLKAQGLNIGTYDEFDASLANKADRDWYYRKAKINGMNVGTPEEFESAYVPVAVPAPAPKPQPPRQAAPATPPSQTTPPQPSQAQRTEVTGSSQDVVAEQAPTPLFEAGSVVDYKGKPYRFEGINEDGEALMRPAGSTDTEIFKIDELNKGSLHTWEPSKAQLQAGAPALTQKNNAFEQLSDNVREYMKSGKALGYQTVEGEYRLNPSSGRFEKTYLAPDGRRTFDKAEAEAVAGGMRLQKGRAEKAAEEAYLAANHGYAGLKKRRDEVEREMRELYDKRAAEQDSQRDPHRKKDESFWDAFARSFGSTVSAANRGMHPTPTGHDAGLNADPNSTDERLKQLIAEHLQLDKAIGRIELEARHTDNEKAPWAYRWALNAWEGVKDKLADPSTLSMGITDMSIAGEVSHAAKQGGNAATGQKQLLQSAAMANQAIGEIGSLGATDVAGTVTGMVFDPKVLAGGMGGALAAKGIMNLGGRYFLKGATNAAGKRYMASTLGGRLLSYGAGGGGNIGLYQGLGEVQRELPTGDWDAGAILSETAHGLLAGSATGAVAPLLGNVADKLVKGTTNTIGKAGVRAGELATSVVAEGTIFSIPEWLNPEGGDRFDIWTDNMAMMLGFKAQHGVKSVPRVISEFKEDYARKGKRSGLSFEERLRRNLDRSPGDADFSKEELEELSRKGYDDLSVLFKKDNNVFEQTGDGQWRAIGNREVAGQKPEFEGYDRMEMLMADNEVSEATRAKAYYLLTGHRLPMSSVAGYTRIENPDGTITVNATNARGGVITSRRFNSKRLAEEEMAKIQRQAELNSVDVGERAKEVKQDFAKFSIACLKVAGKHPGATGEAVMELYKRVRNPETPSKEITEGEREWASEVDEAIKNVGAIVDEERPGNIRKRIKRDTGIDVDRVLSTQPNKRSKEEQEALEAYMRELYPRNEDAEQTESGKPGGEAGEESYNPDQTGYTDVENRQPQNDETARRTEIATTEVDARANDDDGMVHGLTMKLNDRRVYLKKGRIVMTDDGIMVDTRASDHDLWIYDPATGKTEMTTPDAIFTVDEPVAADQLKEETAQQVQDEAKQTDKYQKGFITIRDAEGNERRGTVTGERGQDGRIKVFVESGDEEGTGEFMEFTSEELDGITVDYEPEESEETPKASGLFGNIFTQFKGKAKEAARWLFGRKEGEAVGVFHRNDTGDISLIWGDEKAGLCHIIEKHVERQDDFGSVDEMLDKLTDVVETGELSEPGNGNLRIDKNGYRAILAKTEDGKLVITVFDSSRPQSEKIRNDADLTRLHQQIAEEMNGELVSSRIAGNMEGASGGSTDIGPEPVEDRQNGTAHLHEELSKDKGTKNPLFSDIPSEEKPQASALSRIPTDAEGNPDFQAVDPETAEAGLTEFMGNEADAAEYAAGMEQDAFAEVKKTSAAINKVPFSRNPAAWKEAKAIAKHADDEARRKLEHWRSVQKIYKDRAEAKRAREAEAQRAASQERFMEEKKRKEQLANEMQAAGGANSVHPSIVKKWSESLKTDGMTDVLKYGDMELPGHYVLVEAGAATASHDPKNAYQPTEGFPQDENGANINDRDYEHDASAQKYVESIAADYDQQAIQDPVVVSPDGVVLSGNNRTMSGDIAAMNGTDGKYVDYLKAQAAKFGFTPEEVGAMKHPRVLFVTDQRLPYTTETMAHFNKRKEKSMPMDAEAIANGKRVSDETFGTIVRSMMPYERVSDFANSKDGVAALYQLVESGALSDKELAKMLTPDKTKLSGSGIEQVMSVLIGKAFQGNEKAVYQLLNTPTMRNNVMMALGEIAANRTLADGYTLADELAQAVDLCYRARNSAADNPFPEGTPVSIFAMQGEIDFDAVDPCEIKDPTQGTVLLLADLLNSKETAQLRKILADYNDKAREAAAGQADMFTGEPDDRETILKRINDFYNNATRKEQLRRQAEIIEQRRQAAGQEPAKTGDAPAGGGGKPAGTRDRANQGSAQKEIIPNITEEQAKEIIADMEVAAADARELELTPENWKEEFGDDGRVKTPLGEVKMGENQIAKLFLKGRTSQFGMIKPTLEKPHVVIEVSSEAVEGETERGTSYLFVKTFKGKDGKKIYYFKSVTVKKDGLEVSVSSHYERPKRVLDALKKGKLLYRFNGGAQTEQNPAFASVTVSPQSLQGSGSKEERPASVAQGEKSVPLAGSQPTTKADITVGSHGINPPVVPEDKVTKSPQEKQAKEPESSDSDLGATGRRNKLALNDIDEPITEQEIRNAAFMLPLVGMNEEQALMRLGLDNTPERAKQMLEAAKQRIAQNEARGFDEYDLAEAKEIADNFDGTNLRGEIQRKMHIGYYKAGKIVKALNGMPEDKPRTLTEDELVARVEAHPMYLAQVVDNPNEHGVKNVLSDILGKVRLELRKEWLVGDYVKLTNLPGLFDRIVEKAFERYKVHKDKEQEPEAAASEESSAGKVVRSGEGYSMVLTPYTNKKGKTTDCFLVKFDRELTKAERDALNEYCKEPLSAGRKTGKGWFDRVKGGWMMRSEDAAKGLTDIISDESGEAVADNAPLTPADLKAESQEPRGERPTVAPMNQVNVEDLLADVNNMVQHPGVHRGEVKLSDHSKPVEPQQPTTPTLKDVAKSDWGKEHLVIGGAGIGKETAKPEPERQVSDEEMSSLADQLRDILGEDNDGADNSILFRDGNGELTKAEKMKVFTIGTQIAMGMIERGTVDFPDFAAKLIKGIGESVRPFIKSFYSGAMRMPGMEGYRYTPQAEVDAFDIANFDAQRGVIAAAQQKVDEQQAQDIVNAGADELKKKRNEQRKKDDEQKRADTEAITGKAAAVASQAARAKTAEEARDAEQQIDQALDKVNGQLALLGYYEAVENPKDYNEAYGYMRNAERKAVADAARLARQLVDDLGLDLSAATTTTDKKGKTKKKPLAKANIAPAGGDVTIELPLDDKGNTLHMCILLSPTFEKGGSLPLLERGKGGKWDGDNLEVSGIYFRVEGPDKRWGSNTKLAADVTYGDMLTEIRRMAKAELGRDFAPATSNGPGWTAKIEEPVTWIGHNVEYLGKTYHIKEVRPNDDKIILKGDNDEVELALDIPKVAGLLKSGEMRFIDNPKPKSKQGDKKPDTKDIDWDALRDNPPFVVTEQAEKEFAAREHGFKLGDAVIWDAGKQGKYPAQLIDVELERGMAVLDTGSSPMLSVLANWSDISHADASVTPTASKPKKGKKAVKPTDTMGDLFSQNIDDENVENSVNLQKTNKDEEHVSNRLDTDQEGGESDRAGQGMAGQSGRTDDVGTDASGTDGGLRPGQTATGNSGRDTDGNGEKRPGGTQREGTPDDDFGGLQQPHRPARPNEGRPNSGGGELAGNGRPGRDDRPGTARGPQTDGGGEGLSSERPTAVAGQPSGPAVVKKPKPQPKYIRNFRYGEDGNEADHYTPLQRLNANVSALEVLTKLLEEGRPATDEERVVMSRFRGWGQVDLKNAYDSAYLKRNNPQGTALHRLGQVIDTLDPNGEKGIFEGIKRAAQTAYYTPTPIARAMNTFLPLAGFRGGKLLDPSMGSGIFEGALPKDLQERTMITGVELDWLTGQLARALYPDADVRISGFEKAGIMPGSMDVVTSNVPFGDFSVNDPTWKNNDAPIKRSSQKKIHNYFAVKMLECAKPGGLVAMMTTRSVMDTASNQNVRQHIVEQGEFLGAIRMPDNTFQGTGAVADIIFIRKWRDDNDAETTRSNPEYALQEQLFLTLKEDKAPNKLTGVPSDVKYNSYYFAHPKNMIGDMQAGGQYSDEGFGLHSTLSVDEIAGEIEKAVKKIVGSRKGQLFNQAQTTREVRQAVTEEYQGTGDWVSNGNIIIQNGKVGTLTTTTNEYKEVTRMFEENPTLKKHLSRFTAMGKLRTAMKQLIAAQLKGEATDETLAQLRKTLKANYDAFVARFGKLQSKENEVLCEDIDGYTIRALEKWKDGKFLGLSDMFTTNTIKPALKLDAPKTPQEAISVSLAEYGELRPDYLAKSLGEDWTEKCGDMVFEVPNTDGRYETRDEYLSGEVVKKLAAAREAAKEDPRFERNVNELLEVQPVKIPYDDIAVHFGARWIPQEIINDFVRELLGLHPRGRARYRYGEKPELRSGVVYLPETDSFEVHIDKDELGGEAEEWKTGDRTAAQILGYALEDKSSNPIMRRDSDGTTWVDQDATELVNSKIEAMRERFQQWLPLDDARAKVIEDAYNERFNSTVLRKWDGSHLNIPGLMDKELRPHQKDAVWMLINSRGGIVDHIVGAGKTLVMQSAIMEMRRMGIAKKPMIVALKSTVSQIAREFKEAYPTARVLAPSEKDFQKKNRKKFIANIALNDYDCVILSHEQYCMLPHSEEAERAVIDEQLQQLDAMIEYLYGTEDKSQLTKKQIKALEKRRLNLLAKMEKRLDRSVDREFCFEDLGVDYLFVDESHQFKSVPYVTSYQKIAGLGSPGGSAKAVALLTGIRYLQKMHQGDRGTIFLSGTTITNSLVEVYNLLNYLRPRKMRELGMTTFDAWASTFAVHSSELEADTTGEFRSKDRFRNFDNVPELSQLYAEIADVRNDSNLQLPKPKVAGNTVIVPQSPEMAEINREVVKMLQNKNGSYFGIHPKDDKKEPWSLDACTISGKASVSPRLVFPDWDDTSGKIYHVCEKVKKSYDEFAEQKGVQLIFCEIGVPGKDEKTGKPKEYDAYNDIIKRLTKEYGIPRKEIAYIQEAGNDEKRKALFQRVCNGEVRVLIGGVKNMGTGVNVQPRITDMHMLSVPWQPAALEQCIGRGARQGNMVARDFMGNKVRVWYYATEGSLDLYKYQLLDAKGKMFTAFKTGTIGGERSFDEGSADEDGNIDPAEMVAILSGNPVIFEKSKQDKLVKKLRSLQNGFLRDLQRRQAKLEDIQKSIENFERLVRLSDGDVADLKRGGFTVDENGVYPARVSVSDDGSRYGGKTFDKPKEAGEYIWQLIKDHKDVCLYGFNKDAKVVFKAPDDLLKQGTYELQMGGDDRWSIRYTVNLSQDPTAAGTAFRNLLQKVVNNNVVYKNKLAELKRQLEGAKIADAKFPKQKELDEALARKRELDAEYAKLGKGNDKNNDNEGVRYRMGEGYDYERYPLGRVEPELNNAMVDVVRLDEHGFKTGSSNEVGDWIDDNLRGPIKDAENVGEFYFGSRSKQKILQVIGNAKGEVKDAYLSSLKSLGQILNKSLDVETHPDFNKGEDGRGASYGYDRNNVIHRFYGAVSYGGKTYRVKTTVKENLSGANAAVPHSFELQKLELLPADRSGEPESSGGPASLLSAERSSISATKLLKDVEMSYNKGVKILEESAREDERRSASEETGTRWRVRTAPAPTKTGIGYKVFVLKNGKLYPPKVANADREDTPIGVWLDADANEQFIIDKAEVDAKYPDVPEHLRRYHVKSGGKGTDGGSGALAYRPGWHLGEIPYAKQFNRENEAGIKEEFPANFVWAEVEYAADKDYQSESDERMWYAPDGTRNAAPNHALGGINHVPVDGFYKYRTNPDPTTDAWIITGAMRVRRLLKPSEVDAMVRAAGREPQKRQAGAVTDEQVEKVNRQIAKRMDTDLDHMQGKASELAAKLHTPIRIVTDPEEIETWSRRKRRAKGWYDTQTGEVCVIISNHDNVADVESTVFHEVVAHKGLRKLVGEEKYDQFLDEVYNHADAKIKAAIDAKIAETEAKDIERGLSSNGVLGVAQARVDNEAKREQRRRVATDEYFADMAEKVSEEGFEALNEQELSFWKKAKEFLLRLLRGLRLPKSIRLHDKDLLYMLWRSYKNLKGEGGVIEEAQNIVMRDKTGFANEAEGTLLRKMNEREEVAEANRKFNEDLERQVKGTLPAGHIYDLGMPGRILRAAGFPDAPIEMSATRLAEKAAQQNHPFSIAEVKDLPRELNTPLGVFAYGDKSKAENVIIGIDRDGKQFVVGVHFDQLRHGIVVSDVRGIFNKNNAEWLNWISQGKAQYLDKEKIQALIKQQRKNLAEVQYLDLDNVAKVINSFENPTLGEEESSRYRFRDSGLGLDETITRNAIELSRHHADDLKLRNAAYKAIGGNLTNLRRAMSAQRKFDTATVKSVTDLAQMLMTSGMLNEVTPGEVKRLLSIAKNSVGRKDLTPQVDNLMGIMVRSQLRECEKALDKLLKTKGSKINAMGVEVQGELDVRGQRILQEFKKSKDLSASELQDRIDEATDKIGSPYQTVSEDAALDYEALTFAKRYAEDCKQSKADERQMLADLKEAYAQYKAGAMDKDTYKQTAATTKEALRANRTERADALRQLVYDVAHMMQGSSNAAKAWRDAQKANIDEIHHRLNSAMEGRKYSEQDAAKNKFTNSYLMHNIVFAPLATFDQMLKMIDSQGADGQGQLYTWLMGNWVHATEKKEEGLQECYKMLDEATQRIFGSKVKHFGNLMQLGKKLPKVKASVVDGKERREFELTQNEALYLTAMEGMDDIRPTLRRMGLTEETMRDLEAALDLRLIEMRDYVRDEFLPTMREKYNQTYKRFYGASMAAIEKYIPVKRQKNALKREEEISAANADKTDALPRTMTGSLIKRVWNINAIDLNADFFSVILDHVQEMEQWNAYAEFNRDLGIVLSHKTFMNKLRQMHTVYGSGQNLVNTFKNCCYLVGGAYDPRSMRGMSGAADTAMVKVAKWYTAACIGFGWHTALKQLTSLPAFFPESGMIEFSKAAAHPADSWNWSVKNLPIFAKRLRSRQMGNEKLKDTDLDWRQSRDLFVEKLQRWGLAPNTFFDALACAVGAKAVYEKKYKQFRREGFEHDVADRKAKDAATIAYNQSQQSSELAFLSPFQNDRTMLTFSMSMFSNSPMGYERQFYDAARELGREMTPGYREKAIEYTAKWLERDGLTAEQAQRAAKQRYSRQFRKNICRLGVFGFILPFVWNAAKYAPRLMVLAALGMMLNGDEEDEKKKKGVRDSLNDIYGAGKHALASGWLEGFAGGDFISEKVGEVLEGDNMSWSSGSNPMDEAIGKVFTSAKSGELMQVASEITSAIFKGTTGTDPQRLVDMTSAVVEACGGNWETAHEAAILFMRVMQVPSSEIGKLYFDELDATGAEAQKMSPEEVARRYAMYKAKRNAWLFWYGYSDDLQKEKLDNQEKRFISERRKQLNGEADEQVNADYERVQKFSNAYNKEGNRLKAEQRTLLTAQRVDPIELAERWNKFHTDSAAHYSDTEAQEVTGMFNELNKPFNRLVEGCIHAVNAAEAKRYADAVEYYKPRMVEILNETDPDEQQRKASELGKWLNEFYTAEAATDK